MTWPRLFAQSGLDANPPSNSTPKMKSETPALTISSRFSLRRAPILVIAALIAWCPLQTRADTTALSFASAGGTTITGSGIDTLGWAFTLSAPVTVTQLGVWDKDGLGLSEQHQVTIWNFDGSVIEAQMTVPSGTTAPIDSGFRYVTLTTPVLLPAGDYTIGALYGSPRSTSNEDVAINASGISTNSPVIYQGSRGEAGDAYPATDNYIGQSNSYFGPNFQIASPVSAPDSGSTFGLLSVSLVILLGANRLRRLRVG